MNNQLRLITTILIAVSASLLCTGTLAGMVVNNALKANQITSLTPNFVWNSKDWNLTSTNTPTWGIQRVANTAKNPLAIQRVAFPSGLGSRAELSPVSGFKVSSPASTSKSSDSLDTNLKLSVSLPNGLRVLDDEIRWDIRPVEAKDSRHLNGNQLALSLPEGMYDVALSIGAYQEKTQVNVKANSISSPTFTANVGRLRANTGTAAAWEVYASKNGEITRKVLSHTETVLLNEIVPQGEYDVVAILGDASQKTRVKVETGKVARADLEVPTGRINLMATVDNNPAMRPMGWKVFRLDGGRREIASPHRHTVTLVVPPGHYEAIANLNGKERRREFTVTRDTDNSVVLAMDE